jgi:hypothetical protein
LHRQNSTKYFFSSWVKFCLEYSMQGICCFNIFPSNLISICFFSLVIFSMKLDYFLVQFWNNTLLDYTSSNISLFCCDKFILSAFRLSLLFFNCKIFTSTCKFFSGNLFHILFDFCVVILNYFVFNNCIFFFYFEYESNSSNNRFKWGKIKM